MSDNTQLLNGLNLYCSPHSILVLNKEGKLIRLRCPFQVIARHQVHVLREGQTYYVSAVKLSPDLVMLYVVSNTAYQYSNFYIIL